MATQRQIELSEIKDWIEELSDDDLTEVYDHILYEYIDNKDKDYYKNY